MAGCSDPDLPTSAAESLTPPLLDRLLAILSMGVLVHCPKRAPKHVALCLQSVLEACSMSDSFMSAFAAHPEVPPMIGNLLLHDTRDSVRRATAQLIRQKIGTVEDGERYERAAVFFPSVHCC